MPARTTRRTWTIENGPTGDSGKRQPKNEANGGIDGCSDGGVSASAPASSTSQLICRNSPSGSSHVGPASADRWGRSAAMGATSSMPKRGMGPSRSSLGEGRHDLPAERAQALEDLFLGDRLVGVEDEVDEVDAGRLPLLQLADHLLGVADGDALWRFAGGRRAGAERRVAASRPGDG